jgi:spermidine/putrescine transport system permease protein
MMASYLARIYAWRTLMGDDGIINSGLHSAGLIDHPIGFLLFSRFAAIVAEINLYLPFVTLLLYAGLSTVSTDVSEAARDLGAGRGQVLRRVILPLIGPALLAGVAFTFFLSCGDYITPALLGGASSDTFGTAIADQLEVSLNYPLGAAISFVMVAAFVVFFVGVRFAMRSTHLLPRLQAQ